MPVYPGALHRRLCTHRDLCGLGSGRWTEPLLGASGAIAGVMGAYLVYFPRAPIRTLILVPPLILWPRVPAWLLLVAWFVSQFFVSPGSAVAWTAHVGGFLFGAGVGWLWRRSGTMAGVAR